MVQFFMPHGVDQFRGFRPPGGQKSLSPVDWRYRPYNSVILICYTVILQQQQQQQQQQQTHFTALI